jgi:hypothetical protein
MGLQYRKTKSLGNGSRLNVSASRRGPGMSVSQRVGPLTLNSRGRGSLRIAPGLSFRFGKKGGGGAAIVMLTIAVLVLAVQVAFVVLRVALIVGFWLARWVVFAVRAAYERLRSSSGDEVPERLMLD